MENELGLAAQTDIIQPATYVPDRNPALVYLASLAESSRRPMAQSLAVIAGLGQPGYAYEAFP